MLSRHARGKRGEARPDRDGGLRPEPVAADRGPASRLLELEHHRSPAERAAARTRSRRAGPCAAGAGGAAAPHQRASGSTRLPPRCDTRSGRPGWTTSCQAPSSAPAATVATGMKAGCARHARLDDDRRLRVGGDDPAGEDERLPVGDRAGAPATMLSSGPLHGPPTRLRRLTGSTAAVPIAERLPREPGGAHGRVDDPGSHRLLDADRVSGRAAEHARDADDVRRRLRRAARLVHEQIRVDQVVLHAAAVHDDPGQGDVGAAHHLDPVLVHGRGLAETADAPAADRQVVDALGHLDAVGDRRRHLEASDPPGAAARKVDRVGRGGPALRGGRHRHGDRVEIDGALADPGSVRARDGAADRARLRPPLRAGRPHPTTTASTSRDVLADHGGLDRAGEAEADELPAPPPHERALLVPGGEQPEEDARTPTTSTRPSPHLREHAGPRHRTSAAIRPARRPRRRPAPSVRMAAGPERVDPEHHLHLDRAWRR